MKHIRKIGEYGIVGSIGIAALLVLSGCSSQENKEQLASNSIKKGAFVIIEEQADGSYKILEEHPSDTTRVLLKSKDGTERMLSEEEIQAMLKEEEKKIDNGTSQLTNPTGTGLSIGEENFQAQQRTTYKTPQAYERSRSSFNQTSTTTNRATTNSGRSGFFGGGNDRNQGAVGG